MRWRRTDIDFAIMRVVEDGALSACKIDKDYYNKHRNSRRSEITIIKQIICHYLRKNTAYSQVTIGEFLGLNHATVCYHNVRCQDLIETDKIYAKIYKDANDIIRLKLAEMGDNY